MTTTNRFENWRIRLLGALALMLITMGLVQAVDPRNGMGTPCATCPARCYSYSISHFKTDGGCKNPNGSIDWSCMTTNCMTNAGWCAGCIAETTGPGTDCGSRNCWFEDLDVQGGNLCSNGCYGAVCQRYIWQTQAEKTCGQVQRFCQVGSTSLACSQCGCQ